MRSASGSVLAVGVRIQRAPAKSVSDPAATPVFSFPAIGCAPTNRTAGGMSASARVTRSPFTLPTSLTMAPGLRQAAHSWRCRSYVSTGVANRTKSAPSTPSRGSDTYRSIAPISTAVLRFSTRRPMPMTESASFCRRKIIPSEPPISPTPIIATCLKCGLVIQ